jgi:hypothetical protein
MIKKTLTIISILILFTNCRKEIEEGTYTTSTTKNTQYFVKPWRLISFPSFSKGRCFEIFNDKLYIAASKDFSGFGEDHILYRINAHNYSGYIYPDSYSGSWDYFEEVFEFNDYGNPQGVFTMNVLDNKLYIGGDFRYGNNDYDLLYIDNNEVVHSVLFSNSSSSSNVINHIGVYNDNLVVCGNFTANNNSLFSTNFVELIQNNVAVGMANLNGTTHDSQVFENELYVVGEQNQIVKWNGTDWEQVIYPGMSNADRIYSMEVFNDELYFLGDFWGAQVLKKYSSSEGWSELSGLTNYNIPTFAKLRVLDAELFVIGQYFKNNNLEGSVWRYEGNDEWRKFGDLKKDVKDIIKYKSKYYAVADDGVYLY